MRIGGLEHPKRDAFGATRAHSWEALEFGNQQLELGRVFGAFHPCVPHSMPLDGEFCKRLLFADAVQQQIDGVVVPAPRTRGAQ